MGGVKIVWGLEYPFHDFPVGVTMHILAGFSFVLSLFFGVSGVVEPAGGS